ncbi:MAG: leucine-rich repeat domain-containing protein [Lachnospiraceae bacterium]|nr:leucine-rich repeat domain-containing protein [Lachnospiraceae bacterium]
MGKKIRKALGAVLMAIAIAVTQIPVPDVEAVDTASTSEFQMNGTTLVKYNGTAQNVSISDYVEKIESQAFAGNEYVQNVTIGKNVQSIGTAAFEECSALKSVTIPDSVISIGNAAFADCPALKDVSIGKGLETLGNGVFAGDIRLKSVSISSDNPNYICSDGAIYSKVDSATLYEVLSGRQESNYTMPSAVTNIKPYAFWGDRYLESVSISGNVGEISAYAFSNCANLKNVDIPYSVKTIGMKAFENCIRLRNITIPISVGRIHSTAFDGCTKLTIDAVPGSTAKAFADSLVLEDIDITEYEDTSLDTINDSDEEENSVDTEDSTGASVNYYHEVTHINSLEDEEDDSVKGKSKVIGSQVFVFMDNTAATVNTGTPDLNSVEGVVFGETGETIGDISGDVIKGGSFPKYEIIDNKVVANQAYYNSDSTSIDIPETITEIGEFAFARSGITFIEIPDGVTKIGYAAFYHCDGLTDIVIPNSVTEIGPSAFAKTPWLQDWEQNGTSDFLIVGDGILLDYRGNTTAVIIPAGVKTIGAGAFTDNTGIKKVIMPDSVEVIGEGAFSGCNSLTDIEFGDSLTKIKDRAFDGCPIQNIRIPESVEEIGLRAFAVADSVRAAKTGNVVFEGVTLPKLSYEDSSGKLYNDAYRGLAFEGVDTAVIPDAVESLDGTVLDEKLYGFRGTIRRAGESQENNGVVAETAATESGEDVLPQGVTVNISGDSIDNAEMASAAIDGVDESYILNIIESDTAKDLILEAYGRLNGNNVPSNLLAYDITLYDTATSIPITGLGRNKIEITIPLPDGVYEENLHVICMDANGQLEEVVSSIFSTNGVDYLTFTTNHFSPYAVYNYVSGTTASAVDGQAVFSSGGNRDASPDTGDNSIHPKWFLCIGFLFTGLSLFFYRGRRRKI